MHRILERQIKRYLGEEKKVLSDLKEFFDAVSRTYDDFESDHKLIEHSLELSSKEMGELVALLRATLDSANDGILVTDLDGKTTNYNKRFVEIWDIPEEVMSTKNDSAVLDIILEQLNNPEDFMTKVRSAHAKPNTPTNDELHLKDGRVIERYSRPQTLKSVCVGRIWSFHDVTEQKDVEAATQAQLNELERLNKLMVNRELKMIELKKKIEMLEPTTKL